MRLGDLPADRQAQTGILPETFRFRPVGIEALENAVDIFRLDAGPVVLDIDDATSSRSRQPDRDLSGVLRNEGAGVFNEVGDDLADPQVVAIDGELGLRAGLAVDDIVYLDRLLAVPDLTGNIDHVAQEHFEIERSRIG